ncbi:hypothetical protein [Paraburkholderia aspalathi]|jgi:hypothetical protein|uniref:Uncharacterized protein n=1 Tax=Paraburkholderia aspalathi TaxID=1324617 RepID=A0A1I7ELW3_9BURK|nr:hypothetical protein [Paraburkholderia aspalathi]CAE6734727.1 hypothetical protein R20943_02219 [Paraburkholderia aspalathi]SFU24926.1 hypothetical protein SAMN05192563_103116 [Paraburkholderia aspalathi]
MTLFPEFSGRIMCTGMALYGTDRISPLEAYKAGHEFFSAMSVDITTAGYTRYIEVAGERDVELVEVPFDELKSLIESGVATDFRIYNNAGGQIPWRASFGYNTPSFGGFFGIDAQLDVQLADSADKFIDYIKRIATSLNVSYGIAYEAPKMTSAFYYAAGSNLAKLKPFENPSAFGKEVPGGSYGAARYQESMLRMVYPINVISDRHLNIVVGGIQLKEWIVAEDNRGSLQPIGNDLWLWLVPEAALDSINQLCGEAGILISWKPQAVPRPGRKLP